MRLMGTQCTKIVHRRFNTSLFDCDTPFLIPARPTLCNPPPDSCLPSPLTDLIGDPPGSGFTFSSPKAYLVASSSTTRGLDSKAMSAWRQVHQLLSRHC